MSVDPTTAERQSAELPWKNVERDREIVSRSPQASAAILRKRLSEEQTRRAFLDQHQRERKIRVAERGERRERRENEWQRKREQQREREQRMAEMEARESTNFKTWAQTNTELKHIALDVGVHILAQGKRNTLAVRMALLSKCCGPLRCSGCVFSGKLANGKQLTVHLLPENGEECKWEKTYLRNVDYSSNLEHIAIVSCDSSRELSRRIRHAHSARYIAARTKRVSVISLARVATAKKIGDRSVAYGCKPSKLGSIEHTRCALHRSDILQTVLHRQPFWSSLQSH